MRVLTKSNNCWKKIPMEFAATVVYLVCQKTSKYRTQLHKAKPPGVTNVTIRNRIKDLVTRTFE